MTSDNKPIIVMADDDDDDRDMARRALAGTRLDGCLRFVENGEQLLACLRGTVSCDEEAVAVDPDLILLDLNMPRVNGLEALSQIKADPALRHIPVVILTTSSAEEDVLRSYDLGVNAFVTKPVSFTAVSSVLREIGRFWFEVARTPVGRGRETP